MKKIMQHVTATAIVIVGIFTLCFMFGEPSHTNAVVRLFIGFIGLALLWRGVKIFESKGLLPEIDNSNDGWDE